MVRKQKGFDEYGRIKPEDKRFEAIYPQQRLEAKVLHKRFTSEKSNSPRIQILADDVGLGKTRVAMIVLFAMLAQKQNAHALVVAPTRMLSANWVDELLNYHKKCLEPQIASNISIEIVTNNTSLKKRLADIQENNTRKKDLKKLVASDFKHAPLCFLAFCLREYFEATGVTRKKSKTAKSMLKWIDRLETIANGENSKFKIDSFHRFFSQNEILRFMRFLRRFAAVNKYGNWLELHADAKSIKAALELKRMGKLNTFIQSLATQLGIELETGKYRRTFDANRRQTGNEFLRLAAETMPRLAKLESEEAPDEQLVLTENTDAFKSLEDKLHKLMRLIRLQSKTDQSNSPLTALDCMAWLYLNGLPKTSLNRLTSPLINYMNAIVDSIKSNKKEKDLQQIFDKNDCRKLMDCVRYYHAAIVQNQLPAENFLSTLHSPWTLPTSSKRPKATMFEKFLGDTVRALFVNSSPKRLPRNAKLRFDVPKRFLELCRDLCRFKQIKEKNCSPCFWDRKKLLHHIFVMYANDLKRTLNEDHKLQNFKPKGKPFSLAIIDEAHNWRHGTKGATEFSKNWAKFASHMLLITATPLQLKAVDLKNMIAAVLPASQWSTNGPFAKLFLNCGAFTNGMLLEAAQRRDSINDAWNNLETRECERLEYLSQSIEEFAAPESKLQYWTHLSQDEEESVGIRTLANAVIDFYAYLRKEMRSSLRDIMIKHLAQKQRAYYCGRDVEKVLATLPVPLHQHFYLTEGISNRASLFNFICMRISSLGSHADTSLRPKLMLGLPSSYSAFLGSAIGSKVLERSGRYVDLLEQMRKLTESSLVHPKVDVTVRIILRNLLEQGEKTLVFCERIKTVTEIASILQKRIDSFFTENNWSNENIVSRFKSLANGRNKIKDLKSILEELSQEIFCSLFPNTLWELKKTSQENFDARILLAVSQAARALDDKKRELDIQKVAEAVEALLEPENSEKQDLDKENHLPTKSIELLTGNRQDKREAILQGFSSPALPFCLICSPVSQEGVNLHRYCREIVLHDLNWNPALLEQRIGRVDRRGSLATAKKLPVEVFVPFLSTSYDEYQYRVMLERAELQELAFGHNEFITEEISEDESDPAEDWNFKEPSGKRRALIGNLIYGLFDMELAVSEEDATKLEVAQRSQKSTSASAQETASLESES